ncbi:Kelch repeat-containing protein [Pedobacter sp.]
MSLDFVSAQQNVIDKIDWRIAGELPSTNPLKEQLGLAGPLAGVLNDRLLIAGGANFPDKMPWLGGAKHIYNDIYLFEKDSRGTLTSLPCEQQLPFKVAYCTSVTTDKGLLMIGGETEEGLSNKVVLVQFDRDQSALLFKNMPTLPFAVANAAAVVIKNKVYLAGGETAELQVSDQLLVLDLNQLDKGWYQAARLPKPLSHLMLTGNANHLYVMGGRKRNLGQLSVFSSAAFVYDIDEDKWQKKHELPYALSAGTTALVGDHIFLFGGDKGHTFHKAETIINAMALEPDSLKKEVLNQIKVDIQSTHPGFSDEVLCYHLIEDTWTTMGSIKFRPPVTTQAISWGNFIYLPTGEVRAGVRTPKILKAEINYK